MNSFQIDFMNAIKNIQKFCVDNALCDNTVYKSKEEELYAVSSDVIYRIMELLDGYSDYGDFGIKEINVLRISTGESLKENPYIELHDAIAEYIKEL